MTEYDCDKCGTEVPDGAGAYLKDDRLCSRCFNKSYALTALRSLQWPSSPIGGQTMNRLWSITATRATGGGWLLVKQDEGADPERLAFRTLDAAREFVKENLKLDKRVRFTKHSDSHYSYKG